MKAVIAALAFLASVWAIAFPAFAQQVAEQPSAPAVMASAPTTSAGAPADGAKLIPLPRPGTYIATFPFVSRGRDVTSVLSLNIQGFDGEKARGTLAGVEYIHPFCKEGLPLEVVVEQNGLTVFRVVSEKPSCNRRWETTFLHGDQVYRGKTETGVIVTIRKDGQ